MDLVFLNGELFPADQAVISPFDRGFLYGDGLFETVRIYGGRGHLLGRHLARLKEGLDYLGISHPSSGELTESIAATLNANAVTDAVLRLTITRGVGGAVGEMELGSKPTVLITVKPLLQNDGMSVQGERIITLSTPHVFPQIGRRLKTLNYLTAVYSARELAAAGVREGVLLTEDGRVVEGTVSNMFCVMDGALYTPPVTLGILPGITRGRVLELALDAGITAHEREFDRAMLAAADECFYTNSVRELAPVVQLDNEPINDGKPGPMTLSLLARYRAEVPVVELVSRR